MMGVIMGMSRYRPGEAGDKGGEETEIYVQEVSKI
jgi:hypothetical protein